MAAITLVMVRALYGSQSYLETRASAIVFVR